MQSIYVFIDITKVADFRLKNADVSRTQGVADMFIYFWIFFREGITLPSFIIVEKGPPYLSSPDNANPE